MSSILYKLPIYNMTDRIQEKQRRIAKSLEERVRRIKKAFKGDYIIKGMHPLFRKKFNSIVSSKLYDEINFINEISQFYYLTNVTTLPIKVKLLPYIGNEIPHNPIPLNANNYMKTQEDKQ
ncbi:MAG: hypothetical protein J1E59_08540 [Treponema sp.]|nr:hypothetical protein [Treponema sp.]